MAAGVHRLFFALRPDAGVLAELADTIAKLKATQRIRGRWLKPEKLHLTLQFLGDFVAADEVARRAQHAGDLIRANAFEFVLDRAETFAGRFNPPCVLRCSPASEPRLQACSRDLGAALAAADLAEHVDTRTYLPHVTLAYADHALAGPIAINPIIWRATEFCLLDSLIGRSTHAELARWRLHR